MVNETINKYWKDWAGLVYLFICLVDFFIGPTVWNTLKPFYQNKIKESTRTYSSAKRLKYKLMAATGWYDLDLETIRGILVYTDTFSHNVTGTDIMYGHEFLKPEDND